MKLKFEADITVMLREKDVDVLVKALQQLIPETPEEAEVRRHLLSWLSYLAMPEDTRQ
jgi:hypothetical protein